MKSVSFHVLPETESVKLLKAINLVYDHYAKLSSPSKEVFAGRVLGVTADLQYSNLHTAADALLWKVFRSIDSTWVEHNDIESQLLNNSSFYEQTYDLPKGEKILLKVIEMQDSFYGGIPSNDNLRVALGDLYDEMGKHTQAQEQWEIAKAIDERLVSTSIIRADQVMERFYSLRTGTYRPKPGGI